jgi:hypothetical protein
LRGTWGSRKWFPLHDKRAFHVKRLGNSVMLGVLARSLIKKIKSEAIALLVKRRQKSCPQLNPILVAEDALKEGLLYPDPVVFAMARNPSQTTATLRR